jgi:hypothetical protein
MGLATEAITNNSSSSICERKFWCFVLLLSIAAAKRKVPNALEYFESEQFKTVCGFLDLNPEWLRSQALSPKPLDAEINSIYIIDPNPFYRLQKRARAKSRLEESSNKGNWITGPGVILESGVQLANQV